MIVLTLAFDRMDADEVAQAVYTLLAFEVLKDGHVQRSGALFDPETEAPLLDYHYRELKPGDAHLTGPFNVWVDRTGDRYIQSVGGAEKGGFR